MKKPRGINVSRRELLTAAAIVAYGGLTTDAEEQVGQARSYLYLGRADDYKEWSVIDPGLAIVKIESFTRDSFGIVRITTNDGRQAYGQLSTSDPDITATVLHRQIAPHVLGSDPAQIDALNDRVIDANMKYPWSYVCRALAGIDTAIWDLYGKIKDKPVCVLIGGKTDPFPVYGSSMRRDITPEDEAARISKLCDLYGFTGFKVRAGVPVGHNRDAAPGRTKKLIPAIRRAVGESVRLMADGNSCYTPPHAIEIGKLMQDYHYYWFEEPCPYWEMEWTAEVAAALDMFIAGGEQDNDMAQWRRMIRMNVVDIVQPDVCYVGGLTRALRVAGMAQAGGKKLVPHSSHHSLITLFALHLMSAIPNAGPFVEFSIEPSANAGGQFFNPELTVKDGKVKLPDGPGWGVTINPDWLAKAQRLVSERSL